jgi:hypothetical protein
VQQIQTRAISARGIDGMPKRDIGGLAEIGRHQDVSHIRHTPPLKRWLSKRGAMRQRGKSWADRGSGGNVRELFPN